MRLIHKLTQRRDHHLAEAGRYQELITMLENDPGLQREVGHRASTVADQALALAMQHGASNGDGTPKKRSGHSIATRKKLARRMRKLWKTQRAVMLKGVRKGGRRRTEASAKATTASERAKPKARRISAAQRRVNAERMSKMMKKRWREKREEMLAISARRHAATPTPPTEQPAVPA